MSKIGRQPVKFSDKVTPEVAGNMLNVSGPKGKLSKKFPKGIEITVKDSFILVSAKGTTKEVVSLYGTARAQIDNMVKGVEDGWKKTLELIGTGYRAEVSGKNLILAIGYSHPVKIEAPDGISFKVEKNQITIEGIDKYLVGQVSARVRAVRPPEPYQGKGIKYIGEVIRRKSGKAAKGEGTTA